MSQNPLLAVDGEEAVGAHASPVPCSRMCNRDVDGKLSFALSSLVGKKFGDSASYFLFDTANPSRPIGGGRTGTGSGNGNGSTAVHKEPTNKYQLPVGNGMEMLKLFLEPDEKSTRFLKLRVKAYVMCVELRYRSTGLQKCPYEKYEIALERQASNNRREGSHPPEKYFIPKEEFDGSNVEESNIDGCFTYHGTVLFLYMLKDLVSTRYVSEEELKGEDQSLRKDVREFRAKLQELQRDCHGAQAPHRDPIDIHKYNTGLSSTGKCRVQSLSGTTGTGTLKEFDLSFTVQRVSLACLIPLMCYSTLATSTQKTAGNVNSKQCLVAHVAAPDWNIRKVVGARLSRQCSENSTVQSSMKTVGYLDYFVGKTTEMPPSSTVQAVPYYAEVTQEATFFSETYDTNNGLTVPVGGISPLVNLGASVNTTQIQGQQEQYTVLNSHSFGSVHLSDVMHAWKIFFPRTNTEELLQKVPASSHMTQTQQAYYLFTAWINEWHTKTSGLTSPAAIAETYHWLVSDVLELAHRESFLMEPKTCEDAFLRICCFVSALLPTKLAILDGIGRLMGLFHAITGMTPIYSRNLFLNNGFVGGVAHTKQLVKWDVVDAIPYAICLTAPRQTASERELHRPMPISLQHQLKKLSELFQKSSEAHQTSSSLAQFLFAVAERLEYETADQEQFVLPTFRKDNLFTYRNKDGKIQTNDSCSMLYHSIRVQEHAVYRNLGKFVFECLSQKTEDGADFHPVEDKRHGELAKAFDSIVKDAWNAEKEPKVKRWRGTKNSQQSPDVPDDYYSGGLDSRRHFDYFLQHVGHGFMNGCARWDPTRRYMSLATNNITESTGALYLWALFSCFQVSVLSFEDDSALISHRMLRVVKQFVETNGQPQLQASGLSSMIKQQYKEIGMEIGAESDSAAESAATITQSNLTENLGQVFFMDEALGLARFGKSYQCFVAPAQRVLFYGYQLYISSIVASSGSSTKGDRNQNLVAPVYNSVLQLVSVFGVRIPLPNRVKEHAPDLYKLLHETDYWSEMQKLLEKVPDVNRKKKRKRKRTTKKKQAGGSNDVLADSGSADDNARVGSGSSLPFLSNSDRAIIENFYQSFFEEFHCSPGCSNIALAVYLVVALACWDIELKSEEMRSPISFSRRCPVGKYGLKCNDGDRWLQSIPLFQVGSGSCPQGVPLCEAVSALCFGTCTFSDTKKSIQYFLTDKDLQQVNVFVRDRFDIEVMFRLMFGAQVTDSSGGQGRNGNVKISAASSTLLHMLTFCNDESEEERLVLARKSKKLVPNSEASIKSKKQDSITSKSPAAEHDDTPQTNSPAPSDNADHDGQSNRADNGDPSDNVYNKSAGDGSENKCTLAAASTRRVSASPTTPASLESPTSPATRTRADLFAAVSEIEIPTAKEEASRQLPYDDRNQQATNTRSHAGGTSNSTEEPLHIRPCTRSQKRQSEEGCGWNESGEQPAVQTLMYGDKSCNYKKWLRVHEIDLDTLSEQQEMQESSSDLDLDKKPPPTNSKKETLESTSSVLGEESIGALLSQRLKRACDAVDMEHQGKEMPRSLSEINLSALCGLDIAVTSYLTTGIFTKNSDSGIVVSDSIPCEEYERILTDLEQELSYQAVEVADAMFLVENFRALLSMHPGDRPLTRESATNVGYLSWEAGSCFQRASATLKSIPEEYLQKLERMRNTQVKRKASGLFLNESMSRSHSRVYQKQQRMQRYIPFIYGDPNTKASNLHDFQAECLEKAKTFEADVIHKGVGAFYTPSDDTKRNPKLCCAGVLCRTDVFGASNLREHCQHCLQTCHPDCITEDEDKHSVCLLCNAKYLQIATNSDGISCCAGVCAAPENCTEGMSRCTKCQGFFHDNGICGEALFCQGQEGVCFNCANNKTTRSPSKWAQSNGSELAPVPAPFPLGQEDGACQQDSPRPLEFEQSPREMHVETNHYLASLSVPELSRRDIGERTLLQDQPPSASPLHFGGFTSQRESYSQSQATLLNPSQDSINTVNSTPRQFAGILATRGEFETGSDGEERRSNCSDDEAREVTKMPNTAANESEEGSEEECDYESGKKRHRDVTWQGIRRSPRQKVLNIAGNSQALKHGHGNKESTLGQSTGAVQAQKKRRLSETNVPPGEKLSGKSSSVASKSKSSSRSKSSGGKSRSSERSARSHSKDGKKRQKDSRQRKQAAEGTAERRQHVKAPRESRYMYVPVGSQENAKGMPITKV